MGKENKLGRPAPDWIVNLKKGKYTAKELAILTGVCNRSVRQTMLRYGAKISYEFNGKAVEGVLDWSGFKDNK